MLSERVKHQGSRLAVSLLIVTLFTLIVSKTLVSYLATIEPNSVDFLQASSPNIGFALGNRAMGEYPPQNLDSRQKKQIRDWVTSALRNEPLNARGLEILGLLAASDADLEKADQFMSAAARLSLRRRAAIYWIMQREVSVHDYAAAAKYADALLRDRPQSMPLIISSLATMAETPGAREALVNLLADNPPWRSSFFLYLKGHIRDPRAPLKILLALKATPHPPRREKLVLISASYWIKSSIARPTIAGCSL